MIYKRDSGLSMVLERTVGPVGKRGKRVRFQFDERSLMKLSDLRAMGFEFQEIQIGDRLIIIPAACSYPPRRPSAASAPESTSQPKGDV